MPTARKCSAARKTMEDLLPYYERELAFLRRYSRDFAERYPKIAGRLLLVGDISEDPHVERLIESFALMGARISKKIEDDYPEFTEALLEAAGSRPMRQPPRSWLLMTPAKRWPHQVRVAPMARRSA